MTGDVHEQARQWIALGGFDHLADEQWKWLQTHLQECASCGDYAQAAGQVIGSLRTVPVAARPALVRATQMRVRDRARQLREERERLWLVAMSCFLVGLSTAVTTPLLWRAFQWIGSRTEVSSLLWQAGFAVFAIAPAILTSVLLLGRGVHFTGHGSRMRGQANLEK